GFGVVAKIGSQRALRIKVKHEHTRATLRQQARQRYGGGGLSYATLLICDRPDMHYFSSSIRKGSPPEDVCPTFPDSAPHPPTLPWIRQRACHRSHSLPRPAPRCGRRVRAASVRLPGHLLPCR